MIKIVTDGFQELKMAFLETRVVRKNNRCFIGILDHCVIGRVQELKMASRNRGDLQKSQVVSRNQG